MVKFNEDEKLNVIQRYLDGRDSSYHTIAKSIGTSSSVV